MAERSSDFVESIPDYAFAYCFECGTQSEITAVLGQRRAPVNRLKACYVAVSLECGHARHGDDRVVMSQHNLDELRGRIWVARGKETASAL